MGKKSDCQVRERRNIAMTDIVIGIQGTKTKSGVARDRLNWIIRQILKMGGMIWEHFQQNLNKAY